MKRVALEDQADFFRSWRICINSGLGALEALYLLSHENCRPGIRSLIELVSAGISKGDALTWPGMLVPGLGTYKVRLLGLAVCSANLASGCELLEGLARAQLRLRGLCASLATLPACNLLVMAIMCFVLGKPFEFLFGACIMVVLVAILLVRPLRTFLIGLVGRKSMMALDFWVMGHIGILMSANGLPVGAILPSCVHLCTSTHLRRALMNWLSSRINQGFADGVSGLPPQLRAWIHLADGTSRYGDLFASMKQYGQAQVTGHLDTMEKMSESISGLASGMILLFFVLSVVLPKIEELGRF